MHSTSGTAGGYQLGAGATLPPLLLDDEEAVAVALGLRTSASGSVTGIEEASVRALLKLEQEGYVTSEWGVSDNNRRAKFYRLTRSGRKQVEVETTNWNRRASAIARLLKAEG